MPGMRSLSFQVGSNLRYPNICSGAQKKEIFSLHNVFSLRMDLTLKSVYTETSFDVIFRQIITFLATILIFISIKTITKSVSQSLMDSNKKS